eukprot:15465281-Alexandrium_andersonii.AAC.1
MLRLVGVLETLSELRLHLDICFRCGSSQQTPCPREQYEAALSRDTADFARREDLLRAQEATL